MTAYVKHYSYRAELFADLAHPEGALALVFVDFPGEYEKSGISGRGAWAWKAELPPSAVSRVEGIASDLQAVQAIVAPLADALPVSADQTRTTIGDADELSSMEFRDDGLAIGSTMLRATRAPGFVEVWTGEDEDLIYGGVTTGGSLKGLSRRGLPYFSLEELWNMSVAARAASAEMLLRSLPPLAGFTADYGHVELNSQSLGVGTESIPPKTPASLFGNMQLGDSVRPKTNSLGITFPPYGDADVLKALKATVENGAGDPILSAAAVAALPRGAAYNGESPVFNVVELLKYLTNRHFQTLNAAVRLVATASGVGNRRIAELTGRSGGYDLFGRGVDAARRIKIAADGLGKTVNLPLYAWIQGEADMSAGTSQASYMSEFYYLLSLIRDRLLPQYGQAEMPAVVMTQTGGYYTRADRNADVAMAQLRLAREQQGVFLAGPNYPWYSTGDHKDANGSRGLGAQIAKVANIVINQQRRWLPTHPVHLEAFARGRTVVIPTHVPSGALRFRPCVSALTPVWFGTPRPDFLAIKGDAGLAISDQAGDLPITSVELVHGNLAVAQLSRDIVGQFRVLADTKDHGDGLGGTNIADTDATITPAANGYIYQDGSGDDPAADLGPTVNGKGLPLHNYLCTFSIPGRRV